LAPAAQFFEQALQGLQGMARTVLFTWRQYRIEYQAQVPDDETVQHMAGTARFVGVVAFLAAFLASIQRLDGRIQIKYPITPQCCPHAVHQGLAHPAFGLLWLDGLQCPAYRVLAEQRRQARCLGRHGIALNLETAVDRLFTLATPCEDNIFCLR
jgi:hypothetical protein